MLKIVLRKIALVLIGSVLFFIGPRLWAAEFVATRIEITNSVPVPLLTGESVQLPSRVLIIATNLGECWSTIDYAGLPLVCTDIIRFTQDGPQVETLACTLGTPLTVLPTREKAMELYWQAARNVCVPALHRVKM